MPFYQRHFRDSYAAVVTKGLLATTLGLAMTACASTSEVSQQSDLAASVVANVQDEAQLVKEAAKPQRAKDSEANADLGEPEEPNQPLDVAIEQLNLTPGMSYGQVRSLVMGEGWVSHTVMNGAAPDNNDTTVKKLNALGFIEAQACSGTGQGFCRFEFVRIEETPETRPVLVIVTVPGDRGDEPNFYSWNMENATRDSEDILEIDTSDAFALEANATYADRNFSEPLYKQIVEEESYCLATGECGDVRYLFKDVLMIGFVSNEGFGSTEVALIPHKPISKPQAISHARILDQYDTIDFSNSEIADNNEGELVGEYTVTETFFEANLPAEGVADVQDYIQLVNLSLVPNSDKVSEISFKSISL